MKKILGIALGVVTSIGGFLDVGSIATSAQAGAAFGYSLLWALLLGTLCVIFLVEMSGRFSAVSGHTVVDAIRKRFGFPSFVIPLAATLLINLLVLASEIGGACIALQLVTGVSFQVWAIPVSLALWLLLWLGTFDQIENGTALLGLVTLCFVAGVFALNADMNEVLKGFMPTLPPSERPQYLFLAVSTIGATIAPYMFMFYSSGAIEDHWDKSYVVPNRFIAVLGMSFGSLISMAVMVVAALTLLPQGIRVEEYEQAAIMLVPAFGKWGFYLFAASLAIACFGAALEVSLTTAYSIAQGFGWTWGENLKPCDAARFSFSYTAVIILSALIVLSGVNPLRLTLFSMAITTVILPLTVIPFFVLMNDRRYVGEHVNSWFSNGVVVFTVLLSALLAIAAIPLEIVGSK